jgi:hypothetical protein
LGDGISFSGELELREDEEIGGDQLRVEMNVKTVINDG